MPVLICKNPFLIINPSPISRNLILPCYPLFLENPTNNNASDGIICPTNVFGVFPHIPRVRRGWFRGGGC